MPRKILIVNGHPDPSPERLCAALARAYSKGARKAGHAVEAIAVGALDFPLIASEHEFTGGAVPAAIAKAQDAILWADHLVIIHPLWLGGLPARLKAFFEQVFRYGFALSAPGERMRPLLKGRSVRIIVTMGMPAPVFRLVFGAFGLRAVERGMLWICGFAPVRHLVLGGVGAGSQTRRLKAVEALGARAR